MECRQHQRLFSEQRLDYRCRHCAHGHFGKSRYLRDYENEVEGRSFVLGLFMVAMMIPVHSTLIPLFSIFNKVGLTDHPVSLILSYVAFNMPITIMILLGFYYTPKEVEEAAVMDGRSVHRVFFRIVLPMTDRCWRRLPSLT